MVINESNKVFNVHLLFVCSVIKCSSKRRLGSSVSHSGNFVSAWSHRDGLLIQESVS